MGLVPSLILMLAKLLFIIGFALPAQASRGFTISPSPAFFPVIPHREVTQGPSPIQHGESWESSAPTSPSDSDATLPVHPSFRKLWRTIAPTTPAVPNGPLLHPPVTLPPPASAPMPENITGSEPSASPSPSTIILSPPPSYMVGPAPSASEGQVPPSVQQSPPESGALTPVSTPDAPAPIAIPSTNMPKKSPVGQPTEHDLPPDIGQRNANRSHNLEPVSPGQVPSSVQQSPPENKAPTPVSTPDAPAPIIIPSANMPKNSPVGQPTEHDLAPNVGQSNANRSHNLEPVLPAPVAMHSVNLSKNLPRSPPTEDGSLPPIVYKGDANKSHSQKPALPALVVPSTKFPNNSPISQPTGHGSLPPNFHSRNSNTDHNLEPVSPSSLAIPPITLPKISPIRQPTIHGNLPRNVHKRTTNEGHNPEPVPEASVTSPTSAFPVNPSSVHPVIPAVSPSELRAPVVSPASMPSRIFNWKKGGAPVAAPLYQKPKPLPAVIHSPPQAPAAHKAFKHFHQARQPLISSPKSPFNKGFHSPASSPSTSFSKHHHKRNIVTSPAPASSYLVSPHTSINQGQAMPPSLLPTSGRRHYAPPPVNSATPFSFPALPPASQVSHAPSPLFEFGPHPTKIPFLPPKVSPSESSSKRPKTPVLPQVQSLPPPPPNEDCLSIVCTEPYTNSLPGAPCRCVWPMQVGLRLGVSLYTFFPLVSELASEIATGVFMKQSQVRIMGAKSSNQQAEKTDVLLDLVPLGEKFDNTTAFLTSERFWHKKVVIKASDFGDYEVLYVSYPGLPPSPPLPPSSITMIDGGPYSNDGNNGRTIKPLGVDIPKRQHKSGLSSGVIAIISLSAFVAVVLCSAAAWVLFRRRDHVSQTASTPRVLPPSLPKTPGTAGSLTGRGQGSGSSSFRSSIAAYKGSAKTFSMNDIERATDNFHDSRILGEGGFGRVYSGTFEDGIKVAVKVLKREDHHGDREFLAEIEMLSRLHHRNLVKLIGICTEDNFRCLVYELISNGSVESHLHGVDRETNPIDWDARMKIALGAARGLAYLHEDSSPRVIHRDFKSSNILLEDDFTPKVSDFGLARIATDEDNRHISTRVMGTFGYVAPEYAMTGHLLVKSDVYSYGVVLLELLTGRKPVDMSQPPGQENLVAWARPLLTSKEGLKAIVDPSLGSDVPFDSVAKVSAIASMCVQPEVSNRPFMGEVVQALKLVCNECDEAKEACSRSSSKDDLSIDLDMGVSTVSGQLPDNFQSHQLTTNFDSEVDIERGLSASELFSSSARFGRQVSSGSFRRHSYSGPLRTGRNIRLWQIMRRLSGGSVSEHGEL